MIKKENKFEELLKNGSTSILIKVLGALAKIIFLIYDVISFIPYKIFADPTVKLQKSSKIKAAPIVKGDNTSPWRNVTAIGSGLEEKLLGCSTIKEAWDKAVHLYGDRQCFGTREILAVTEEKQKNGRIFEKLELGSYHWHTFSEANDMILGLSKGLRDIGVRKNDRAVIYSETREEWMISAMACFRSGLPRMLYSLSCLHWCCKWLVILHNQKISVATVYASLGIDAVAHSIRECEATTVFTTALLLPKIAGIIKNCQTVKYIICFPDHKPNFELKIPTELSKSNIRVLLFEDILRIGDETDEELKTEVDPDDIAMIMYTSGTTGNPKGVVMLHKNLVAATGGQRSSFPLSENDVYIGYLPLAHILEVCAELVVLSYGAKIGYSAPTTLFDSASRLKKGQRGDCSVLKPTLLACIPAIMDRIFKAVTDKVAGSSPLKRELFRISYERKRARYEEGYTSSLLNGLVFNNIRKMLGGRLRFIASGGAPLNPETQRFMNICFCCPVLQGYGLTETCGGGTLGSEDDLSTGTVGAPLTCCDILLREWEEGGYSPKNKVPQGEILIGGENVALGYLNNEEKTREVFHEIDGKRYFTTGDIGEFREDGSLCIIDRKKDLLKLSHGEYVSLGKVESTLSANPIVDTICICGDSTKDYVVALIVPKKDHLIKIAEEADISTTDFETLCRTKEIKDKVLSDIQNYGKAKLHKAEIPYDLWLCSEPWTPDSGLLTEALKLKRKNIERKYKDQIAAMYNS
ncbi:unnamed protein product [Enterobius vermicularis]|uniref:long-chain-fatty-acid--CoA ligase n=1 Tax=Enterobius vermicularis TaxID=51028 RepID=A0A0N4VJ12_ENTVE|nr:unnamed protein product [Enterobius vermicularis]